MADPIARPSVQVIQRIRTVSPTVVSPTLMPCVVGVCRQVVDVLSTSASSKALNSSALITLPAVFQTQAGPFTGLDGLPLVFSVNNGPDVTVTFSGSSISLNSLVAQVNDQLLADEVTEAFMEKTIDGLRAELRTVGRGEFETIEIKTGTSATVLTALFGSGNVSVGYIAQGRSLYNGDLEVIPFTAFPDPNNNLSEVTVEQDSVRVFLSMGTGINLREALRKESYLRRGGAGTAANLTGTTSLATGGLYGSGGTLDGTSLTITFEDATVPQFTVAMGTGAGAPTDANDLLQKINVAVGKMVATNNTGLKITSKVLGVTSRVRLGGTAATVLGFTGTNLDASGTAAITVVDDGNGDNLSPLLAFNGLDFTAVANAATCTGAMDITGLTYPGDVQGKTLELSIKGGKSQTYTVPSTVLNQGLLLSGINAFFPGVNATVASNRLVLTNISTGEESTIRVMGGTLLPVVGLVPRVVGTINLAVVKPDLTALNTKKLKVTSSAGTVEVTFSGLSGTTPTSVSTFLNGQVAFAALFVASIDTGGFLCIRMNSGGLVGGVPLEISITEASSAESAQYLGFDFNVPAKFHRFEGRGFPPASGDDLYVDGVLVGRITQNAPGGVVSRLRINKQLAIDADYGNLFWIQAKNLTGGGSRPEAELTFDATGAPYVKHDLLRDTNGVPVNGRSSVYLSYTGIRKDVTALASNPGLLRYESTTQMEAQISPVNVQNPLALGLYFALINAPGCVVSGLGVDAVSADLPEGTVEAYTRAAEFLESYEVYAIAPMSREEDVAQLFDLHVTAMSEPKAKGERICIFNPKQPTKKLDTLVASGVNGNSYGSSGSQFDTGVVGLPAFLLSQGIDPTGTIPVSAGVFLDIASDSKRYSIASVAGGVVTIRTTFGAGENDDGFYSTTLLNVSPLPTTLIAETFAVRVRGVDLTNVDGTPDKAGIADTYQALGVARSNRRFIHIIADAVGATLGGIEQRIPGMYYCAARVGMIGQQAPQQSMTNFPTVGFTRVYGTNGYFSESQLDLIAGGGNDIIVQDAEGAALTSRMALTTDMTSVETRTDNVNKEVDFVAKFARRALRVFIGRFNISQGFLDSLSHVAQGIFGFVVDLGVLRGAQLNEILQEEGVPDSVIMDALLEPAYPCNYIKLMLGI